MKNKVLIFGGTGNISKYLTDLLSNDYDVTILNINGDNIKNVKTIKGDINDISLLEKISLENYDVVFDFLLFNSKEARTRIEIFNNRVKQYFYISSVVVFDRDNNILINEKTKKYNPYSDYAKNKLEAEKVFEESTIPYTIIRPSQTYSDTRIPLSVKGDKCYPIIQRIIDDKEVLIHGDGTNIWACMHSIDMANILKKLILNPKAIREDFNVCGTEILNFNMIYQKIANQLNKKLKPVYITSDELSIFKEYDFKKAFLGDKRYSGIFDISKLISVIGEIEIKINIDEGIKRYLSTKLNRLEKDDKFNVWCDNVINKIKNRENN